MFLHSHELVMNTFSIFSFQIHWGLVRDLVSLNNSMVTVREQTNYNQTGKCKKKKKKLTEPIIKEFEH